MLVGHCGGAKDEELLFAGKAGAEGVGFGGGKEGAEGVK